MGKKRKEVKTAVWIAWIINKTTLPASPILVRSEEAKKEGQWKVLLLHVYKAQTLNVRVKQKLKAHHCIL